MPLIGLYGTGGCARGIMPLLRAEIAGSAYELVFIDDDPETAPTVNGHRVMRWEEFAVGDPGQRSICIGIASPVTRARLAEKADKVGIDLHGARAANAILMDDVKIGEGACLSPFVTITSNILIGRGFHANLYSYVEHDCIIGDFVTFAPGAKCNGNVHIGDGVYIGSGAILRQGTPDKPLVIGAGATIGMGAVVVRDVAPHTTVVGNPARILGRR
ncbi:MAG: NeuD/PglB/VioB family sugar acetyltransferase [Sphingopyxis sp.]